jgi:hypothetical protein
LIATILIARPGRAAIKNAAGVSPGPTADEALSANSATSTGISQTRLRRSRISAASQRRMERERMATRMKTKAKTRRKTVMGVRVEIVATQTMTRR